MKKLILIFTIVLLFGLLLFAGCNRQASYTDRILSGTASVVEEFPDSALYMLDSIVDLQSLNDVQLNKYILLNVAAKYKCDQDITKDSLVFGAYKYYTRKNDLENMALSAYYCGRVRQEQKRDDDAIEFLLLGKTAAEKTENKELKGLIECAIGEIFYRKNLAERSLIHFRIGKEFFIETKDYKRAIGALNFIGCSYLTKTKLDSALLNFKSGLELAKQYKINNNKRVALVMNLGVLYFRQGYFNQAKESYTEALNLTDSTKKYASIRAKLLVNLAQVYYKENQPDSVLVYVNKSIPILEQHKNLILEQNIYRLLSDIEEKNGEYEKALRDKDRYCKTVIAINTENRTRDVLQIQRKYNFQLIQNENYKLQIRNQHIAVICLVLLLILGIAGFIVYRKSITNKRFLREAELKIHQLTEVAEKYQNEKTQNSDNPYQDIVLQHFDILRKVAAINSRLTENDKKNGAKLLRKFNEIVYGEEVLDWEHLYQSLNGYNKGFFDRIRKQYPKLSETEFKICCLLYAEFDNTDISTILDLATGSTRTLKTSLRKKIGIEKSENIINYLNAHVQGVENVNKKKHK